MAERDMDDNRLDSAVPGESGDAVETSGEAVAGTAAEDVRDEAPESASSDAADAGQAAGGGAASGVDEDSSTLNEMYDHLRHSTDTAELDAFAVRPLPDPKDASAFSRATALLEAIAGNLHTSVDKRVFLAESMKFPNVLVKLSEDPEPRVRAAVAANAQDKNWLAGRLTKDSDVSVREAALKNPQTSWKMRMEGAEDPEIGPETLDFLGSMGTEEDFHGPAVLATMVRRAVALNPSTSPDTLRRLAEDASTDVSNPAKKRLAA